MEKVGVEKNTCWLNNEGNFHVSIRQMNEKKKPTQNSTDEAFAK